MTQNERILNYLKTHPAGLTVNEWFDLTRSANLRSRIANLNAEGHGIVKRFETKNGKTWARYYYVGQLEIILK